MSPATVAVLILIAVVVYQRAQIVYLSRCGSWGIGSQGAWHWRMPLTAMLAWLAPVDVLHFDVDRLKQLNSTLGEERVNQLLRQALRRTDLYRLQHGDECIAIVPAGKGLQVADSIKGRLAVLPLTSEERAALGAITVTTVVASKVRNVKAAVSRAVRARETAKAEGVRGVIIELREVQ